MNKTSHTDEPYEEDLLGYNQSPSGLSNDLTTNQDMNGIVNARTLKGADSDPNAPDPSALNTPHSTTDPDGILHEVKGSGQALATTRDLPTGRHTDDVSPNAALTSVQENGSVGGRQGGPPSWGRRLQNGFMKFCTFIGPGFMIAVAYIDPGNYSTGVAAGATFQFRLLFVVLFANIFAIFLQTLCIKLGTVSGLNLAQACRLFLPRWLNYLLYFFAEAAIIATDIAEVIGFAIGLNLLVPKIPLVAGCAISIIDVMLLLLFYQPNGSMKGLRVFEFFIVFLVLAVVICFCIQLSLVQDTSIGKVFRGYLPSDAIAQSEGLYQACGILGATVMPHSLYLGSGIVQPRIREYDEKHGNVPQDQQDDTNDEIDSEKDHYVPSPEAIKHCYRSSKIELAIALFTFALFVNSAIVIVAGTSLYQNPDAPEADIFSIHKLLSSSISKAAGTIFALALLLSGVSAGIVCTITGQMVSEGALRWKVRPWLRRLITRSISIIPSVVIAAAVGRSGLNAALNASQVVLSIVLPFVSAPLIWFTCRAKYMTIRTDGQGRRSGDSGMVDAQSQSLEREIISMANAWYTTGFAIILWLVITVLNVANLVLLGLGN